jgi:hypothetical protein
MGLKDWFAGNVAGPKGCGNALGRSAREAGSALGNAMFSSHGNKPANGSIMIFDSVSDIQSAGFEPYSETPQTIELTSLNEAEQSLLKNLHVAMISYVFIVNSNAALQYMRRDNTSKFRNGLGPSLLQSTVDCGLFDNVELARAAVMSYVNSLPPIPTVLNMERPGFEDLLEHFIRKATQTSGNAFQYAFVRSGFTGFDSLAITLAEETLKSILAATKKFNW